MHCSAFVCDRPLRGHVIRDEHHPSTVWPVCPLHFAAYQRYRNGQEFWIDPVDLAFHVVEEKQDLLRRLSDD
jgi:hypothetical protein